jgi:hypothetical protein
VLGRLTLPGRPSLLDKLSLPGRLGMPRPVDRPGPAAGRAGRRVRSASG